MIPIIRYIYCYRWADSRLPVYVGSAWDPTKRDRQHSEQTGALPIWRQSLYVCGGGMSKRRGNCYVTCEALYHLLGGKEAGWIPMRMRWERDTHWFLRHASGLILDPTASQFQDPPTHAAYGQLARGSGFLTKCPSKRARELMDKLVWQGSGRL